MNNKLYILTIVTIMTIIINGCGMPACELIVYDSTKDELLNNLEEYSLPDEFLNTIMTRETFNDLVSSEAKEIILNVNSEEVSCDSMMIMGDSVICKKEDNVICFSIKNINQIEVLYENSALITLKNSAILGVFASSLGLLGYIPPNPPQPNWKSFVALFGTGFILGIIFEADSPHYYCFTTKESFIQYVKEYKHNFVSNKLQP